jgi:hypothetical protein
LKFVLHIDRRREKNIPYNRDIHEEGKSMKGHSEK